MENKVLLAVLALTSPAISLAAVVNLELSNGGIGAQPTPNLPEGWAWTGCYADSASSRVLHEASYSDGKAMTGEACVAFCSGKGYNLAGVGYGQECWCGFNLRTESEVLTSECDIACVGDGNQACGGRFRLTVYEDARTLSNWVDVEGGAEQTTVAACTSACKTQGFVYSGVEYGRECWCGASIQNSPQYLRGEPSSTGCEYLCLGNASEFCGGSNRLNLYQLDRASLVRDGDFEYFIGGWQTTSNPTLSSRGQLRGQPNTVTRFAFSGRRAGQIEDGNPRQSKSRSLCLSQTVNHRKMGPHDFSAAIGRAPPGAEYSNTPIQYGVYVDNIQLITGPVCIPHDSNNPCHLDASNGKPTYGLVQFTVNVPKELLGLRKLSICAIYAYSGDGEADIFIVDDVSVAGPA